jgi:hypothetical protein
MEIELMMGIIKIYLIIAEVSPVFKRIKPCQNNPASVILEFFP